MDTGFEAYNYNVLANPHYQRMFDLAPVKTRFFDQTYDDNVTTTVYAAFTQQGEMDESDFDTLLSKQ